VSFRALRLSSRLRQMLPGNSRLGRRSETKPACPAEFRPGLMCGPTGRTRCSRFRRRRLAYRSSTPTAEFRPGAQRPTARRANVTCIWLQMGGHMRLQWYQHFLRATNWKEALFKRNYTTAATDVKAFLSTPVLPPRIALGVRFRLVARGSRHGQSSSHSNRDTVSGQLFDPAD
jgi:hypothetical protein